MSLLDDDYQGSAPEPGLPDLQRRLQENWSAARQGDGTSKAPKQASNIWEAIEAGWQMGTTSLAANYVTGGGSPDLAVSANQGRMMNIASHAATMVGDLPAMLMGGVGGALTPIPGGAEAGAFALPAFVRRAVVDSYTKGQARTISDFWDRASGAMLDAGKGAVTGLATAGAGYAGGVLSNEAGAFLGANFGSLSASAAYALGKGGSELGAMTLVGHALDGQGLPSKDDFIEGAFLIAGMHGVTAGAKGAVGALMRSWQETNIPPVKLAPTIAADPKAKGQAAAGIVPDMVAEIADQQHRDAGITVDRDGTLHKNGEPMDPAEAHQWTRDNPEAAQRLMASFDETPGHHPLDGGPTSLQEAQQTLDEANKAAHQKTIEEFTDGKGTRDELHAQNTEGDPAWVKAKEALDEVKASTLARANVADEVPTSGPAVEPSDTVNIGDLWEDGDDAPVPPATAPALAAGGGAPSPGGPPPPVPPATPPVPAAGAPSAYAAANASLDAHIDLKGELPDPRSMGQRWRDWWNNLYTSAYDRDRPILQGERQISGKYVSAKDAVAYRAVQDRAGVWNQAKQWLFGQGPTYFRNDNVVQDGASLHDIFSKAEDVSIFRKFLVASRALEKNTQAEKDGKVNPTGLDSVEMDAFVSAHKAQYGDLQQQVVDFNNHLSNYLIDAGIIKPEDAVMFRAANLDYVPFKRVLDGERVGGTPGGVTNPLKGMEGSQLRIVDPLQSMVENVHYYLRTAQMNKANLAMANLADANAANAVGVFEPVPNLSNGHFFQKAEYRAGEVPVYRDGVRQVYQTTPEIAGILAGVDTDISSPIIRALSVLAKLERMGVLNTPGFIARHAIRNPIMSLFFTQNNLADYAKGVFDAVGNYITEGKESFSARMGARGGSSPGEMLDRDYLAHDVTKLTDKADLQGKAWNLIRNPIEALHAIAELGHSIAGASDEIIRQGDYNASIKAGFSPEEAANRSRQVIPDASRVGSQMRIINSLVPFFHMEWQGMDKLARAMYDTPARVAAVGGTMMGVSAALWYLNKDDSRMDEIPHEQRDLFWCIPTDSWHPVDESIPGALHAAMARPEDQRRLVDGKVYTNEGTILRFPKPFEAGIIFGSGTERVMDSIYKDNPHAFDAYGASLANAALRTPLPAFMKPMVEQFANRSTFTGNPLVPPQVEKELPQYRYNDYTTETGKMLGRVAAVVPWLGKTSFASPIVIENYVRSYAGSVGYMAMALADKALRATGLAPDKVQPDSTWSDNVFTQAFVVRNPGSSMQGIRDFYDSYNEFQQIQFTMKSLAAQGDRDESQRLQQMEQLAFGGVNLQQIQQALAVNAHLIRTVYENPGIKSYEKRQLIDGYYYMMSSMANQGNKMVDAARRIALQ